MLTGMPPFPSKRRGAKPRPLPDDVPEDLGVLILQLLERDPAKRPQSAAEVLERIKDTTATDAAPSRTGRLLVGAAILLVAVVLFSVFNSGSGGESSTEVQLLIVEGRFQEAIELLRARRRTAPDDASVAPVLAKLLVGEAEKRSSDGDLWDAQMLLGEAAALQVSPEHAEAYARMEERVLAQLDKVAVTADMGMGWE